MPEPDVFDHIRSSCAAVAAVSTHVTIDEARIADLATAIDLSASADDPGQQRVGTDESTVAFIISLDAINFGSGYFPHLRKRPGKSGYHTIAASVRDLVADTGPLNADRLLRWTIDDTATTLGQVLDEAPIRELMQLFTDAWNHLGDFVDRVGSGSFLGVVDAADGSAARMVELLDTMPFFHDVHQHPVAGEVLFYKRAQITVQDLAVAFGHEGPGRFDDIGRLTMFADNLVPHVLRVDGVLRFSDSLLRRIEVCDDITIGSPEEVEIRASGLHAVELLVTDLAQCGIAMTAGDLDNVLWNLGADRRYKSIPRHRSRCVFY